MTEASPFHAGERLVQQRAGVAERRTEFNAAVIRDYMPDQHRGFYSLLPFIVIGAVDPDGDVWATLRAGYPGFLHSPDEKTLRCALSPDPDDPAQAGLYDGAAVGLLGIELNTRRRNRLNGTLHTLPDGFDVEVEHAFGNCPQYIQLRHLHYRRDPAAPFPAVTMRSDRLTARAEDMIAGADTFFVASYADLPDGRRQVDVSHRGGRPGFVRIAPDGSLIVPDFAGNQMFNTLGNFAANPRAGLVLFDDATGDVLQMTGRVGLLFDPADMAVFQGAERFWQLRPEKVILREAAFALVAEAPEDGLSPATLRTGTWKPDIEPLTAQKEL
jgi:uncharacterized protein